MNASFRSFQFRPNTKGHENEEFLEAPDSTKAGSSVFGDPAFPEGFAIERTEAMRGREMSLILRASLNSKLNDLIHHNSALGLLETFQPRVPKHEIACTLALQWRECYI